MQPKDQTSSIQAAGEQPQRNQKSRPGNTSKKDDHELWEDNLHFQRVHEDPEISVRLENNMKHVHGHDKFIEYIRHVESKQFYAKRTTKYLIMSAYVKIQNAYDSKLNLRK